MLAHRRNPDVLGTVTELALLGGLALIGYEVIRYHAPALGLPNVGQAIANSVTDSAGVAASQVLDAATGIPTQTLINTLSPDVLESAWEQWNGPLGIGFWGKPATLHDLVDEWFNGAAGSFLNPPYDPTIWGAFTSYVIVKYAFVLPSNAIDYFNQRAKALGGAK